MLISPLSDSVDRQLVSKAIMFLEYTGRDAVEIKKAFGNKRCLHFL